MEVKISAATQSKRGETLYVEKRDEFGCDQLQLLNQDQSVKLSCRRPYSIDTDDLGHGDHAF